MFEFLMIRLCFELKRFNGVYKFEYSFPLKINCFNFNLFKPLIIKPKGGVGVELLWDFLYRPLGGEAFYWYLGAGPSVLFADPFWLGISGEAGLEYRFKTVPIALGADWRPTFWIIDDTKFSGGGFGFMARFVFGHKKK